MSKSKIHLDAAGAPPLIPNIIENWTREITNEMYLNPHSCFKTKQRIKSIRNRILNHFNVSNETHSVIFTSNSTAACKLFAESINWSGKNFQYLNSNHTSIVGIRETVELNLGSVECINDTSQLTEGSFVAFPAQCNFSGQRINLEWINSKFKTLIDTASYLSSSKFDLSETKADCIIISFYKLFGFPTGVGALVVRNDFAKEFMTEKSYFGGGTVTGVGLNWVSFKSFSEERFENGSIPFLEIIAIDHGFDYINGIGGWNFVESFTLGLREYAYNQIRSLEYRNGNKLALIYQDNDSNYGPIVSFNLLEDDSNYIGYAFVNKICKINNIHLRTGCFCNPGACRKYLGISEQEYKINHNSKGHVCGDDLDLIDSKPTGAIRISFSISNTRADIDVFISFLKLHFLSEFNQEYPTFKSNLQNIKIIEMNLYPIKSCGAMSVRSWQLSETGFKYDRYWSLVDSLGKTMSLSRHPKMCLIKPISIIDDILCIEIESLRIYISVNSHKNSDLNVVMCGGKNIPAYSNNDPKVSEIFSKFLGVSCTLVSSSKTFQNKSSFLIVSNSSVEVVNLWCNETVTPLRFRPNIVISGFDAFQEDSLVDRKVKIGENIFSIDEICSRCQVVGVDQETATVSNELFSILARRRRINGKVAFGVYARTEKGTNFLNVGDKLILI